MLSGDLVGVGRQLLPEVPAHDLELDGLDELALELGRLPVARVHTELAQLGDERLGDAGGEPAARVLEGTRDGDERRISIEPFEPKAGAQPTG